ncbi:hypothetical protein TNCT_595831 [Trichonephila clavata]|uniref:Uncharacterized protein n=1 Tax=Trichonephila clavata TaxID=2740835 RepID=A0A8X6FDG4_TRICU|nr:hypothetical protein TNCT_595831 [Trichonephila clavata]
MFKELVKSIIAYRKEKQLLSLQLSETLKKNIQEDIISAFELSKPLVSHHIKLFRSSNSFFDFLLKLIDVDLKEEFVGRDDYVQQNLKKFEDEHKKNENYEYKIKQITEENDACQKELKKM